MTEAKRRLTQMRAKNICVMSGKMIDEIVSQRKELVLIKVTHCARNSQLAGQIRQQLTRGRKSKERIDHCCPYRHVCGWS